MVNVLPVIQRQASGQFGAAPMEIRRELLAVELFCRYIVITAELGDGRSIQLLRQFLKPLTEVA